MNQDEKPGWKIIVHWRVWLRSVGLDDSVHRPTERTALIHLEAEAFADDTEYALPLTALERTVYTLEREYMRSYHSGPFMKRYGVLSPGQKYAWIARHRPELGLTPLEVRAILDDVYEVVNGWRRERAVERLLENDLEKAPGG